MAVGETSQGGKGIAAQGANGNQGYLGKSASGDIYAGANGNVYKRDDGQWYQKQNGSWNAMEKGANVDRSNLEAQRQQAANRDWGNRNSQMADKWKVNGGAARRGGFEGRP